MWLNGTPIGPATTYSVTVNSFLATGGDSFLELDNGAGKQDTGKTDLQAMVDYMDEFANTGEGDHRCRRRLQAERGQRTRSRPAAPAGYAPGDHVIFNVWAGR